MTRDQAVLLAVGVLALACLALLVGLVRTRSAATRAAADLAVLRHRLDELERAGHESAGVSGSATPSESGATAPVEFLITDLGRPQPDPEPLHLSGPAFADIVLKESVVKAASLVHGVRRGLAPATRNRIRFEMRLEVRRARKQRRADLKAAQRDLRARQRAEVADQAARQAS
ncbi:MAG: hypothetical protein QM747_19950 [Nocardioides sp.]